jgi:hypothetical protein
LLNHGLRARAGAGNRTSIYVFWQQGTTSITPAPAGVTMVTRPISEVARDLVEQRGHDAVHLAERYAASNSRDGDQEAAGMWLAVAQSAKGILALASRPPG